MPAVGSVLDSDLMSPSAADVSRKPTLVLGLIVIAAAILRLVFFSGLVLYDDASYVKRAYELSTGLMRPPTTQFEARIGLVGPTALLYRAFGVGPRTTVAFPLACSLLSVLAAAFFGARLFGVRTGLLASLLLAIFPMDVIFASELFATTPSTLLVGSGLGLFLLAERSRRPLVYLASGLALGLAALVFYPLYVVFVAPPSRKHAIVLAGLVLAASLDPLIHGLMGDPWARVSSLTRAA